MKKIILLNGITLLFLLQKLPAQINTGSFQASVQFPTSTKPMDVAVGDLDQDGKIDIVSANITGDNISVLRNQSSIGVINPASFASAIHFNVETGGDPYGIAVGDLDGDGKPEIVTANRATDSISIFLNASTPGNINASSFSTRINFWAPNLCRDVVIADLDGDGLNDIAAVGQTNFSVWRNTSTIGNISFASRYDKTHNVNRGYAIDAEDIDGDGKRDIAVAGNYGSSSGRFCTSLNQSVPGGIAFQNVGTWRKYQTWYDSHDLVLGDLNGDNKVDVLSCAENSQASSSALYITTNTSSVGAIDMTGFLNSPIIPGGTQYGGQGVGLADIDGDGNLDLLEIRPDFGTNELRVRRNIYQNIGDTLQASDFESHVEFAGGSGGGYLNYSRMSVADFDGDGKVDVVITDNTSNDVSVFKNTSSTTNTIVTSNTVVTVTCPGESISVPYTCNAPFAGNNIFSAELSDATGSFASPTVIGTLNSTVNGIINATIPALTPAGNNYRIRVTSSNPSIIGSDNGTDIVINNGTPVNVTISVGPNDTVCSGSSITFTATPTNGGGSPSYQWKRNGTNVGTNSVTYSTSTYSNNDVFTCILTSSLTSCVTSNPDTSNPITITAISIPSTPSIISGNNQVCENSTQTYSVSATSGLTYNWTLPSGWSGSSNTNSINATIGASGGTISVNATNSCGTSSNRTLNVTVNPLPTVVASGTTTICDGDTTALSASGASSYAWNNGAGSGANVNVFPSTSTTYTVTGTDANNCSNIDQVTVTVNPLPTVVASGTATICDGDTTALSASGASSYNWNNGAGSGANVNVFPNTSTTYTVTGTDANNCSNNDQVTVTVNPLPDTTVTLSGNTLTAQNVNSGVTYRWLDCNNGYAVIGGATNQNYTPPANGSFALEITENGCTDTSVCYNVIITGVNENITNNFQVYPNPGNGIINIQSNTPAKNIMANITDLLGKKIVSVITTEPSFSIDISHQPKGIYLLQLSTENGILVEKIIVE